MSTESNAPAPRTPRSTPAVPVVPVATTPTSTRPVWLAVGGIGLLIICAMVALVAGLLLLLSPIPPVPVTVMIAGSATQVESAAHTVSDLLNELAIPVNIGDSVSPPLDTPLSANLIVNIERTRAVTVTIDGQPQTFQTLFTNPLDILHSAGVTPGDKDLVIVDGTETTFADMLVWPVRRP